MLTRMGKGGEGWVWGTSRSSVWDGLSCLLDPVWSWGMAARRKGPGQVQAQLLVWGGLAKSGRLAKVCLFGLGVTRDSI